MVSEAFQWTKQPVNSTIVVEGVKSDKVPLVWEFLLAQEEMMFSILIQRGRPDSSPRENIASKGSGTSARLMSKNVSEISTMFCLH